jgi:hypothetical protein
LKVNLNNFGRVGKEKPAPGLQSIAPEFTGVQVCMNNILIITSYCNSFVFSGAAR